MATLATRCPRCRAQVVEIDVATGDGHVVLRSCSACDGRWWQLDGEPVPFSLVRERVRPAKRR